jgi:hypothetical protein
MRMIAIRRDALVVLPTVPGRAVMASKRTRDPACSGFGHTALALLQLLPSGAIRANMAASPDDQRIYESDFPVKTLSKMR